MKTKWMALAVAAALSMAGSAFADSVTVTPTNSQGWFAANLQGTGSVAVTGTYSSDGDGSLQFHTGGGTDKADYVLLMPGGPRLSDLTSFSIDLYRDSSSTASAFQAPAIRLYVDNGQATNHASYLIWEAAYNGYSSAFPTDTWVHIDLSDGNFWQRAFKTTGGQTIELYNKTLNDWLVDTTYSYNSEISNVVGPDARILAVEIGVGSGWSMTFNGAADNLALGFEGGAPTTYNFSAAAVAAPLPLAATMGAPLLGLVAWMSRRRK